MKINELNLLNKDFYLRFENIFILWSPESNETFVQLRDREGKINKGISFYIIPLGSFFDKQQIWIVPFLGERPRVESFNDLFEVFKAEF